MHEKMERKKIMNLNEKHRHEFHSSGISDDTTNKYVTQGYFQSIEDIQHFDSGLVKMPPKTVK